MILEGGIASGFHHVKAEDYKPRLLWFKGKKNRIRVREVPLSYKSLNEGDAFVLDNGLKLYLCMYCKCVGYCRGRLICWCYGEAESTGAHGGSG